MHLALAGTFQVLPDGRLGAPAPILETGAWNDQGYPFFAGTGVYRQTFSLEKLPSAPVLEVEDAGVAVEASSPACPSCRRGRSATENRATAKISWHCGFAAAGNLIRRSYPMAKTAPYGLLGKSNSRARLTPAVATGWATPKRCHNCR